MLNIDSKGSWDSIPIRNTGFGKKTEYSQNLTFTGLIICECIINS